MHRAFIPVAVLLVAGFAGCSDDDGSGGGNSAGSSGSSSDGGSTGGTSGSGGGSSGNGGSGNGGSGATDAGSGDSSVPDATTGDAAADSPSSKGSPGCGKAATPGATEETIQVGSLEREYILSVPAGYDPKTPLPLVFGWHGRTGSAKNFRGNGTTYGGGVEKASAGQAIFVYPNGLPVTSDPNDTGWIDGDPNGRDFALFDALLESVSNELCVDTDRVFSYGHSFGAYMSQALACHRADKLLAIGPVAGGPPSKSSSCPGTPLAVWLMNSVDDKVVLFDTQGIPARNYWIKTNGCDEDQTSPVEPSPCVAYAGCTKPLHWCAPTDEGHGFPTFVFDGIWKFFAAQ